MKETIKNKAKQTLTGKKK